MYTIKFWKDTLERVVSSWGEGFIATFGGSNLFELDWQQAAGITGSLAVLTLIKSLAVQPFGDKATASPVR